MVNDSITQLLFNALAQHRTVVLLGIGSLRFRRVAAKLEGSTLTPPRNMFRYSSREEGRSLLDILIAEAGCTREEGEDAYRRWLRRVKQDHSVVIEGVGRIEDDFFKPSEELERVLNPVAATPIVLRRHRSLRGLWIGLAVVAVMGVAGAAWWYLTMRQPVSTTEVVTQKVEIPITETPEPKSDSTVADEVEAVEEVSVEQIVPASASKEVASAVSTPVPTEVGEMSSGVSYVVMGVFSSEDNARKYISQLSKRAPAIECRIYRFQGAKFMVSGFESSDGAEATAFIRDHRAQFPDLWTYKRK